MARARLYRLARLSLLTAAVAALPLSVAWPDVRDDVQEMIKQTESSLRAGEARQQSLKQKARSLAEQIDDLRLRATRTAHLAQQEEAKLNAIDARLQQLHQQNDDYRRRLGGLQDGMARSVAALARVQRQPATALLAAPGTVLDAARGGRLLAAALPALHRDAGAVGELLKAAKEVRLELQTEQRQRRQSLAALAARRQELTGLLDQRAKSEQGLRKAAARESQRLAMLASKASDLRGLLQRLEQAARVEEVPLAGPRSVPDSRSARETPKPSKNEDANTDSREAGAAAESDQRRRRLAAEMARTLGVDRPAIEAPKDGEPEQRLSALVPGPKAFAKLRGRLMLPAKGRRIGRFGESTGFGPRAQGITLRTRRGAQVVAPYDGQVVFAGPFRDYGLILIISHGGGYHSLLAGLAKLQAVVGQTMLMGEPVGVMGGDDKRSLYVELRRKGTAINPNPWWSSSRERASG